MIPEYVLDIMETLEKHSIRSYMVGGCVRDILMRRVPNDWDVASSARPEEIMAIFPKTVPTGLRYGTVTVLCGEHKVEVTTFRSDGEYRNSRKPEEVSFVSELSEDLRRRDFTVNAMAMDKNGAITDLFGGREDLESRIIRCVGNAEERFREDALRMFRAVRFSAQLGFSIHPETRKALTACAPLAAKLSGERVRDEMEKILLSPRPGALSEVLESGLLESYVNQRTGADFSVLSGIPEESQLRWAGFCGLFKWENSEEIKEFLEKLRLDRHTVEAVRRGMAISHRIPQTKGEGRVLLCEQGAEAALCAGAILSAQGDKRTLSLLTELLADGGCLCLRDLKVSGEDLMAMGIPRGKQVGQLLKTLFAAVAEEKVLNNKEELLAYVRKIGTL